MKIKNLFISFVSLIIALGMFIPMQTFAAAFGVSPPWIVNENLKPGSNFVYVIYLSTNEPAKEMKVNTNITGDPEVMEWVKIKNKDSLVMPKGEKQVPMSVEVNIPNDAKIGKYEGNINLTLLPDGEQNNSVAILLGGTISINLEVIDYDVTDFWVRSIKVNQIESGQPLDLDMTIKNLGNTVLSNIKTEAEVIDYRTERVVARGISDKLRGLIYPQTVKDVKMIIPVGDLEGGEYWVKVDAFKDNEPIYHNRLYLNVMADRIQNKVVTKVKVAEKDMRGAAIDSNDQYDSNSVKLKTTVTVRAPYTNKLIGIVILLMVILVVIVGKIYTNAKEKKPAPKNKGGRRKKKK